ncbi:ssDNA binding protein [Mycobacterium phage Bachome]|nr:ssDNA binding protein [Mycobacterium phage Bachome]
MASGVRRVLVTGSRRWKDRTTIWEALKTELDRSPEGLIVVHGGARGADDIADRWAWGMFAMGYVVKPELHRADWEWYGNKAGVIRNLQMVKAGADICLAFPLGRSPGTRHCMREAERAGIPVINFGDR